MNLFAGATTKGLAIALATAIGLLLVSNGAWLVRASTLEASRDVATADLGTRTTERDAWKLRAGELKAANRAYDAEFKRLVAEHAAAQAEMVRLKAAHATALAEAQAAEADADRTLRAFMDRYAAQLRSPDCVGAMAAVARFCPALEGY
ncbi:hypothetical protein [Pseudoxanthomonas mexicana]